MIWWPQSARTVILGGWIINVTIINGQWLFSSSCLTKAQPTKSVVKGHRRKGKKPKRKCRAAPVVVGRAGSCSARGTAVGMEACRAPGCRRLGRPWARREWNLWSMSSHYYERIISACRVEWDSLFYSLKPMFSPSIQNCSAAMPFLVETFPNLLECPLSPFSLFGT